MDARPRKEQEDPGQSEPFLGDRPEKVVRIALDPPIGTPLALPDGRVMLWYTAGEEGQQAAMARFSSDDGITWSEPTVLFRFPRDGGRYSGGASLVSQTGTIHLFGLDYYRFSFDRRGESKSLLWHGRLPDGAESWEPIRHVEGKIYGRKQQPTSS